MSKLLLSAVALAYLYVALGYWLHNRRGMALAFVAYAISNIGFIIDQWRTQ